MGNRMIGNKSSLVDDFIVNIDKEVETVTKARFPMVTEIKNSRGCRIFKSKKIMNRGIMTDSRKSIMARL